MSETQAINEVLFEKLSAERPDKHVADALNEYTRQRMWSTWHIPNRFFLPEMDDNGKIIGPGLGIYLKPLQTELDARGHLRLDRQGNYACLTGKKPVLIEKNEHGPWQEDDAPAYEPFQRGPR